MNKKDWTYKKLGDVATYVNGFAFKPDDWQPQGTPIIRIQNLNDENASFNYYSGKVQDKFVIEDGDLLISWSASLGVYEWKRGRAFLNQHIFKVVFDKGDIDKFFLKYAVAAQLDSLAKNTHGATMKHIVKKDFDNTPIPVPPLPTQRAIVAELDTLNEILDKKRQQLKELDTLAQSIFYDMFGDPVENEKGWEVKKLGEVAQMQIGVTYKPENVVEKNGTIVLRSSNIQDSELDFEDIVRIDCPIKPKMYVQDGDILMCSRNGSFRLVGKVAKIQNLPEPMTYGAFMTIIRSEHNQYLFSFFKSSAFREQLVSAQTATINQITTKMLNGIIVCAPPLSLQQTFAIKIEAIEKQKELIKASIAEVETLLNATMDKYFG